MVRRTLALSRAYLRLVFAGPVSWLALGAAVLSTYLVSLDSSRLLLAHGLRFQLLEVGLYVLSNQLYVTWSFLFCFLIMVWPMLNAHDCERLLLRRLDARREVWIGRSLALLQLAAVFLALTSVAWLSATAPNHGPSFHWSDSYVRAAARQAHFSEPRDAIYDDAAFEQLVESWNPVSVGAAESGLTLLVLWAIGMVGAIVTQAVPRSGVAFVVVFGTCILGHVALSYAGYRLPTFLLPQAHLIVAEHVPQGREWYLPYWLSGLYWALILLACARVGSVQMRRAMLS